MGELLLGSRYRLEELLGSGGMSVVWQARDEVLDRPVAVKVLHLRDDAARDRIRGEARAAAALSHPNLAQVHDFGDDGFPFLVMELVVGRTLQQHIDDDPLPPPEVFRVCAAVAAGLAAAHAAGLVHQDVKPANIMVTATGAKLVDFGLAAPAGPQPLEDVLGTPAYLAPERLTGHVAPPSDVYALGVLLYLLLAGTLPWPADTTTQLIRDHVFTPPVPLPPLPAVPDEVAQLCIACLDKAPDARPSAEAAAGVLATAATISAVPPPSSPASSTVASSTAASSVPVSSAAASSVAASSTAASSAPVSFVGGGLSRFRRYALAALVLLVAAVLPWLIAGLDRADRQAGTGPGLAPSGSVVPLGSTPGAARSGTAQPGPAQPAGGLPPRGGGSSTTPPAPTGPPTPTGPVAFTTEAGTVQAACAGEGRVRVVTSAASRPYKTQSQQAGPASIAYVEFRHGNDLIRMAFTCPTTAPVMNVTRGTR
ncbi:serine/threonine-protein kinase [Dactylosporangium siamense]|uniref:non-specific serine/threonine protein kinase n=2 Tax=Dactylosporangium siamense TaxID=685454 RepID=A0A919PYF5_9ACTN|nr:hypothetical protein Dsi01nite_086710 [Dactylosporangium siamense]